MANQAISELEQRIRDQAARDMDTLFDRQIQAFYAATGVGHYSLEGDDQVHWNKGLQAMRIVAKRRASDNAVRDFISSYHKLVLEFPQIVEQAREEGAGEVRNAY